MCQIFAENQEFLNFQVGTVLKNGHSFKKICLFAKHSSCVYIVIIDHIQDDVKVYIGTVIK